jgi:transposase-like protein
MAQGKETSETVKAAVMAALLAGQGVNEVARAFQVPKATVSRIKKQIPAEKLEQLETQKTEDYAALLDCYIKETLTTLATQAQHFRDKQWLNRQSAENLAVLHGVTCDKAIRLLEAIQAANEQAREATPGD